VASSAGAVAAAEARGRVSQFRWSCFVAAVLKQEVDKEVSSLAGRLKAAEEQLCESNEVDRLQGSSSSGDELKMGKAATIQVINKLPSKGSHSSGSDSAEASTSVSSSSTAPAPGQVAKVASREEPTAASGPDSDDSSSQPLPMRRGMTMPAMPKGGPPLPKGGLRGLRPPGPPPPLPKAKAAPFTAGGASTPSSARTPPSARMNNGLVNVNWRASEPPPSLTVLGDRFLGPLGKLLDKDEEPEEGHPETAFQCGDRILELPPAVITEWWKATPDKGAFGLARQRTTSNPGGREQLLDPSVLQALGILLQRYKHRMKAVTSSEELVASFQHDILGCNHGPETLQSVRSIIKGHADACSRLRSFVMANGEAALKKREHSTEMQLLHGLLKVPQIEARLQCMVFEVTWREALRKAHEDLELLDDALGVIRRKEAVMRKLLWTALKLGNALNEGSFAPVVERGFRMSSWSQMVAVKCTSKARTSMLHIVLALMWPDDVALLGRGQEVLAEARNKMAATYEHCIDLASNQVQILKLSQTVSKASGMQCEDLFQQRMDAFCRASRAEAEEVMLRCKDVVKEYRSLSIFYEDPNAFYPPPRQDTDPTTDLLRAFHELVETVTRASGELKELGLRRELAAIEVGPITVSMLEKEEDARRTPLKGARREPDMDQMNKVVRRLHDAGILDTEDAQSDVSDWSPGSGEKPGAKAVPPKDEAVRSPKCSLSDSPPSTPRWAFHSAQTSEDDADEPSKPRLPRKSLTAMADRVSQAALRRMSKPGKAEDSDDEVGATRRAPAFSPTRRQRGGRARATIGGSPTKSPPRRPVRRAGSMQACLPSARAAAVARELDM